MNVGVSAGLTVLMTLPAELPTGKGTAAGH